MLRSFALAVAIAAAATAASAEIKPAIVYDKGGKFDKSFNEAAYVGAERFKETNGIDYRDFEIQNDSQREQALRRFARQGHDPIMAIGFSYATAVERVAKEFPDTSFAIVDSVVELPNVRSILFKEHEGSYLVGMLAAMKAGDGDLGFVGGMDIPLIRAFACGYVGGAKSVNADVEVYQNMAGDTGAAWVDPPRGQELAKSQIDRGAEVVYHAAGFTGTGVLRAAAEAGKFGIGVDSNQNYLHPGSVLTSMLKRVDVAVFDTLTDAMNGQFTADVVSLGLAEGGVGWALDENNEALISDEMKAAVESVAAQIARGDLVVHDYRSDQACPY